MVLEIKIKGTFTTGTTIDDPEVAKEVLQKELRKRLKEVNCSDICDIFRFEVDEVKAEKI